MLISLLESLLKTFICYLLVFMTIVIIASPSLNAHFSPSKEKIHPFLLLLSLPAIILIIIAIIHLLLIISILIPTITITITCNSPRDFLVSLAKFKLRLFAKIRSWSR